MRRGMPQQYVCYVALFWSDSPKEDDPDMYARFVTSVSDSPKMAHWEAGEPAMRFSEDYAKDIVFGLCVNGYAAGVVKVPKGVEFRNPPKSE